MDHLFSGFPSLNHSPAVLAKAWAVQAGRFAAQQESGVLGIADTRAAIAEALAFEKPGPEGLRRLGISDVAELEKGGGRKAYVRQAQAALDSLAGRAHPLWGPVIDRYRVLIADLERGRTRDLARGIADAAAADAARAVTADEIDDYLNWMEANAPGASSGVFDGYLRASAANQAPASTPRDNAVTRYLDTIEREFR